MIIYRETWMRCARLFKQYHCFFAVAHWSTRYTIDW